jgi:hypothetical protein
VFAQAARVSPAPVANFYDEFVVSYAPAGPDPSNPALLGLVAPFRNASNASTPRRTDQPGNGSDAEKATDKLRQRDGIAAYTRLKADSAGSSAPRYQSRGSG